MGVAQVPDPRLDRLTAMFKPKKHTPATVKFVDVPGVTKGAAQSLNLPELRQMDGLAVVVRGFESDAVPHPEGSVDPARDLELLETEMLLADLSVVTNRLERVAQGRREKEDARARVGEELSMRFRATRSTRASPSGRRGLAGRGKDGPRLRPPDAKADARDPECGRGRGLGTSPERSKRAKLDKWKGQPKVAFSAVSAPIEQEIAAMSPEDQAEFLKGLGLPDRALDRLLHAAYDLLGLISFLTAGEDECRAWSIPPRDARGQAAGASTPISRSTSSGPRSFRSRRSWKQALWLRCRTHGTLRLEGRDYVVKDGDVINFRVSA